MALSVKAKIRLGTFFLFILLILISGAGIFFLNRLKTHAQDIIKDNYQSLGYGHRMLSSLDSLRYDSARFLKIFDQALKQEEANITEAGEGEAVIALRKNFKKLEGGDTSIQNMNLIREQEQRILLLNMKAIERKNKRAQNTAESALTFIISAAAVVFIIAFTFLFNFPSIVVGPIEELIEAIQQISNKNYSHRIHIKTHDEFGQLADAFNAMAERLEYFENSNLNKLLFEKARAEAVINSLQDASIGIDRNNIVLFANNQALGLLGMTAAQIVGKPAEDVMKQNDLFRFLMEQEGSAPFKIVVDNKENYFIRDNLNVAQDGSSNRVIVLKNITSFKELDVAKTNFIATISHELKTPLASSDFSLKLLEDDRVGKLSAEQKELVSQLKTDNQRMLRILSELLNMSQVEAGKIQLDIKEVSPAAIADNAIISVENTAKQKQIRISKNYNGHLPNISADADKTAWVLNNFLTNAIKYSPEKSELEVAININDQVVFSVQDHGTGIPKEYKDKVFDRFFKVPGSPQKGTGLGLAISKEFIEAQNGHIWVESEVGRGSRFYFSLPKAGEEF